MVFVPGFRRGANDPWAHRKGEPRIFALFWSIYLMVSALVTVFATRALGAPQVSRFHYGASALLVMVGIGATVLWCATRLSQQRPERPARAVFADMVVLLVPIQAVVWPLPILTGWPWDVTAGLLCCLSAWVVLVSGIVLLGVASTVHLERTMWMLVCLLLVIAAPVCHVVAHALHPGLPSSGWLLAWSPMTAPFSLTASPGNLYASMSTLEWLAATLPAAGGVILWALYGLWRAFARGTKPQ